MRIRSAIVAYGALLGIGLAAAPALAQAPVRESAANLQSSDSAAFASLEQDIENAIVHRDTVYLSSVFAPTFHPYQPTAPAVAFLESAPLSDDERAQVAHRNAERVFGITV